MALSCCEKPSKLKNNGVYYCVSCLHSFRTANKLKSHEYVCKGHDYCDLKLPEKNNSILKFNRGLLSQRIRLLSTQTQCPFLKKYPHAIKIQKNFRQQKKTNTQRVVNHYSQTVHLTATKTSMISTERRSCEKFLLGSKRARNRNN